MDKITDLATAIELGSFGSNQCRKSLLQADGATCAVGAAMVGVGLAPIVPNLILLRERFKKQISGLPVHCPQCQTILATDSLYDRLAVVVHLNDHHRWTRPQIALWLRKTLSPSQKQVPTEGTNRHKHGLPPVSHWLGIDTQGRSSLAYPKSPSPSEMPACSPSVP